MSDGCQNYDRGQLGPRKPKSKPSSLLPCPFCGGEPESREVKFTGYGIFQWEVKCWHCRGANAHSYKSREEAEERWNTRKDAAPRDYTADSGRVDWMLLNIGGKEARRLGMNYSAGLTREHIDEAMKKPQ